MTVSGYADAGAASALSQLTCDRRLNAGEPVPLTAVVKSQLELTRLQAELPGIRIGELTLHASFAMQPESMPALMSALVSSVSTLVALRRLPFAGPWPSTPPSWAAFTRLRVLSLRQRPESDRKLPASLLPASLEELTLLSDGPIHRHRRSRMRESPPLLVGFRSLRKLRRITCIGPRGWPARCWDGDQEDPNRLQLPSSLDVRIVFPVLLRVPHHPDAPRHGKACHAGSHKACCSWNPRPAFRDCSTPAASMLTAHAVPGCAALYPKP